MQRENSKREFEKAGKVIPGGVNSPVRAFKGVGGSPVYIQSGQGAYITDIDGNRYLDFLGSWGPLILGHSYPAVVSAIKETCERGTSFGAPTIGETELAEKMIQMVPSLEMVRMVNSGTEATMSAIRLARGYTRRDRIVKFAGCYHGHGDSFLIAAGSGAATLGVPNSPGVTAGTAADTLVAPFNDLEAVEKLFQDYPDSIAAVIVEPVAGNMGVVPPAEGFLQGLRTLTEEKGALLILDEVMTGFRVARGGAQELYGIKPDLSTFGKIIGGGLPVGAYGGRRDIMAMVAPSGPVYQAGTLSGNPLAAAAGLAALHGIDGDAGFYDKLEKKAAHLAQGIEDNHGKLGIPGVLNRVGSMMTFFFTEQDRVGNYAEAAQCDAGAYGRFFHAALEEGLYFAPSAFEATFLSSAHTDQDIETAIASHYHALKRLKS